MSACPTGCGHKVREGDLLCRLCWRLVPRLLQQDVLRTWRATQRQHEVTPQEQTRAIRAWREAAERATNAARERQIKRELRA